jgi:hypothetical protein
VRLRPARTGDGTRPHATHWRARERATTAAKTAHASLLKGPGAKTSTAGHRGLRSQCAGTVLGEVPKTTFAPPRLTLAVPVMQFRNMARPTLFDRPLTAAERMRLHRARKRGVVAQSRATVRQIAERLDVEPNAAA